MCIRDRYYLGRYAESDSLARRYVQLAPDSSLIDTASTLLTQGRLAARRGRRPEAERAMAELASLPGRTLEGYATKCRAAIAAALGDRDRAVQLLRQALGEIWPGPRRAVHPDPDFAPLRGYP